MDSLFISDLHLDEAHPQTTQGFLHFLTGIPVAGDELYILGDLFNAWLGDDDDSPFACSIIDALAACVRSGVRVFVMPGNRDLLLGERFARRSGTTLLPDPGCRVIGGQRVLLAHGDAFCTADRGYQRYRRLIRSPLTRMLLLALPLALRRRIAAALRRSSSMRTAAKPAPLLDVVPATIEDTLAYHDVRLLIHGHTHRPARHEHVNGTRLVLGDWDSGHVRYVRWPSGGMPELQDYVFTTLP